MRLRNSRKKLVWKTAWQKWEDNIKIDLTEMWCEVVDQIKPL
jgi:hypothetical protein